MADLFAGSGSIGLEALSRGAAKAIFVEQSPEAGRILESTLVRFNLDAQSLGVGSRCGTRHPKLTFGRMAAV